MTVADLMDKLADSGDLDLLRDSGLVSWKAYLYRDIFREYQKRIILGESKMVAIDEAGERFKVSQRTVFYAVKTMRRPCEELRTKRTTPSDK